MLWKALDGFFQRFGFAFQSIRRPVTLCEYLKQTTYEYLKQTMSSLFKFTDKYEAVRSWSPSNAKIRKQKKKKNKEKKNKE